MKKPNIIFFLSDDQGAWALNCGTNSEIHTPNLDKLAAMGMRYDNFFCASPVCSPARASIVTGEMPSCHGVLDFLKGGNADSDKYATLKEREPYSQDKPVEYLENHPSYIDILQQNGYTCAHSGKWHLGASDCPKAGFSKWFALEGGGCKYYDPYFYEDGDFTHYNRYVTDVITDKAVDYLEALAQEDAPFYMSVHYTAPHSPWSEENHPKEYLDLYRNSTFSQVPWECVHENQMLSCPIGDTEEKRLQHLRGYYAAITAMDANIGRIIDVLEQKNTLQDTVIIFTADNGMNMGHHGIWGKGNGTYPPNLYDTSVKVPFIIAAPFIQNKGEVNVSLQSHCDLFPTLVEMCGIDNSKEPYIKTEMQVGQSFYKELTGESTTANEKDIMISSEYGAVRMIRTKEKKLIWNYNTNEGIFYCLKTDKDEKKNLIDVAEHKNEIATLKAKMEEFFDTHSKKESDARKYPVTGKGQRDFCYNKNAFIETFQYWHASKN